MAYLAEASRLLADSLEYEPTLATVARLALPELGGWCIVDLVEEDGAMRRLAIVHPDPDKQRLARRLESGWPPERDDPLGVPRVIHTRRSELIPHVSDDMLVRAARTEENLRILRELGIGSLIVVPLLARGGVLGAMTFVGTQASGPYSQTDITFAEDLAARCATSIDNARLYRQIERARARAEVASMEAQAASRAKSQFLAMVSHEIRTPINAVIGYTELLLMGLDGPLTEAQRDKLERVQASSQHLLGLVNQLLDLAKVESGQLTVQRARASLGEVVEAACEIVYPQALRRSLVIENGCEGGDLWYLGDANRVRQILVNLLGNATKFTAPGGRIRLRCGATREPGPEARLSGEGPWVRIEVEDTGAGIPPDKLGVIFEPFVQLSSGLTRNESGTGLGLAISRQLARLMGGDLTVRSRPGEGSCFTLWLPASLVHPVRLRPDGGQPPQRASTSLPELGTLILERASDILDRYVRRLREDPRVPHRVDWSDTELRHHALNFLTGVAQSLRMAHEARGALTDVMRDGTRIQRVISELHGAQRHALGWSQEAVRRDFELLREAIEEEVLEAAPHDSGSEEGLRVLARVLEHASRTALQGWHLAAASRAPERTPPPTADLRAGGPG